ncbi:DUF3846 domain-containing protein [Anaerocolumna aminovalerica]|uniref:DUF3846 domain-containing protein n=1 Tax=Anaerocolumna aminovalerica TaxID=1527 RepID=UPI001C0EA811|nr:DUF3846 domain-containing protein [Anaerocolumna aminovalerica]MBU5332729.1 DUF3846 domain-containing protein [Anaerocolumna aminovalerica]
MRSITVMIVEPKKAPYTKTIEVERLGEELSNLVGGTAESFPVGVKGVYGYCNDEGKIKGFPVNRQVYYGDIIHGNMMLIAFDEEDEPISLNCFQSMELMRRFTDTDISEAIYREYLKECGIIIE